MYEVIMEYGTVREVILRTDEHHFAEHVCMMLTSARNTLRDSVAYWVEAV